MPDVLEARPPIASDAGAREFAVRPLSPLFAAEVVGLDLRQPLLEDVRRAMYDAFVHCHVLAFRDQKLTKDEQIAFSEQFGALERHIARNRGSDNPWVHTVSNLGPDGRPSGIVKSTTWHTDKSFRPEPSLATILHAVTMPPDGGDTCFANMYAAYDALSDDDKAALDGLRVVHSWELSREKQGQKATPEEIRDAPAISHPLSVCIPIPGGNASSWASTPRISRSDRWRRDGRSWRGSKHTQQKNGLSIATAGGPAIC